MTAEEKAMAKYPQKEKTNKQGTGTYDPNWPRRMAYFYGYKEAEKDFTLVPEDIPVLINLYNELKLKFTNVTDCYKEVIKRFYDARH